MSNFLSQENDIVIAQCNRCTRLHSTTTGPPTCDAFPDGIPDEILINDFIHTQVFPGQDNKLLFDPKVIEDEDAN